MPTTTIPDLKPEQLLALDDRMRAAREEQRRQEAAERGRHQALRRARSKLAKAEGAITTVRSDLDVKRATVRMLEERRGGLSELNAANLAVRDEAAALDQALTWATEEGVAMVAGINVPSNARAMQVLDAASPKGTRWSVPVVAVERRLKELVTGRHRLRADVERLKD